MIIRHKYFTRVTVLVTTHVRLSRFFSVHCGRTLLAMIVGLTGWIALGRYFSMKLETCRVLKMTVARGTILPVFCLVLVAFVAKMAWLISYMLFFVDISLLAFLAKITSIQKPRHRSDHIVMIVVMILVDLLLDLRALVHNGIEWIFGHNVDLISWKGLHVIQIALP